MIYWVFISTLVVICLEFLFGAIFLWNWVPLAVSLFSGLIALFLFIWRIGYRNKVKIREVINNRKIIFNDYAKEVQKDGIAFWKLLKLKESGKAVYMPIPSPQAIEVDKFGKKCVDVYKSPTGEFTFLCDKANEKEIVTKFYYDKEGKKVSLKTGESAPEGSDVQTEKKYVFEGEHQPLTTRQRLILIKQMEKAYARKKVSWTQHLPTIVSIGGLVIIVLALIVFHQELAQPYLDEHQNQIQYEQLKVEQMQLLKEIKQGIQTISDSPNRPVEAPN